MASARKWYSAGEMWLAREGGQVACGGAGDVGPALVCGRSMRSAGPGPGPGPGLGRGIRGGDGGDVRREKGGKDKEEEEAEEDEEAAERLGAWLTAGSGAYPSRGWDARTCAWRRAVGSDSRALCWASRLAGAGHRRGCMRAALGVASHGGGGDR